MQTDVHNLNHHHLPLPTSFPRPMPSAISQSTHKEVESFWTEVQHLEKQLNDHETLKRQARKITLKDSHSDQLRLSLLEIYDDLLTSDALHHLPAKNLDDRLWNAVFYSRIEELRSVIGKFRMDGNEGLGNALEELGRCLDLAIAFYQTFILSLSSRLGYDPIAIGVDMLMTNRPKSLTKADMLKDIRFNILHKSIIFLGDIARYRAMYIPMDG
ncbi:hypothetical protein BC829DRAFT_250719 [Chytridium lagenaria]|nr:hypothetical protein BC829DRAFT_250719 [Chytridium lagenaria]